MKRVESACRKALGLGGILVMVIGLGAAIVACSGGGENDGHGGPATPNGAEPTIDAGLATSTVGVSPDGGIVLPSPKTTDAGAPTHPAPPPANDAGIAQTDGGSKPAKDAGSTASPTSDDASAPGDDAGSSDPSSPPGSSSSASCVTGADCFSVPCGCADGTIEYWQACGADGTCLGYGLCLNDQVCANNGGLYDPSAPPATCDSGDPSDCAPVTCSCNDGTVLDYQACTGTACATVASCSADVDDVCNAHGGWVGDAPTPPPDPCPSVVCSCPDGVTYTIPDEQCLGSAACATDLVCSGD